jgi:cation diffusion facilitator family transporter
MDDCCQEKACIVQHLQERQAKVLRLVLIANALMFVVELVAGLLAGSVALLADSLDMLGDALVYGFSLYVVARGRLWKARAAGAKAAVMGLFGAFVFAQLLHRILVPQPPLVETMGLVGGLALAVNSACFLLLWSHRADDINMRSVWLCSRNDLVANVSVLLAAAAVWASGSPWPDLLVGALICGLFLRSAWHVAVDTRRELRRAAPDPSPGGQRHSPEARPIASRTPESR